MTDHDTTVLIVEDESDIRELFSQVITPFANVACASTIGEALRLLPAADVLILDWFLDGKNEAGLILDVWMQDRGGPCCVISDHLPTESLYELYIRGVYNAFQKPVPISVIAAIVRHYVQDVRIMHQMQELSVRLNRMQRNMLILALALTALAGPEVVRLVGGLIM